MGAFKVHIIHVGNMANKGTQALLISDVAAINDIVKGKAAISVSTTDIKGVQGLMLPLEAVLSPMVDIPYEKTDSYARKLGYTRHSFRYKIFALASLFYMFVQIVLSAASVALVKGKLKPFYRSKSLEYMRRCDLVVSCSDENFKESASMLPLNIYWILTWWSMLISRTWEVLVARAFGKPIVMFPNSVGPFKTFFGRLLSRFALNNCTCVIVREPMSYEIVRFLGLRSQKILASDTTLLFNSQVDFSKSINFSSNGVLGVSPGVYSRSLSRKEFHEYVLAHAEALDRSIERYGFSVVFLPHYVSDFSYDDLEVCKLILGKMKRKDHANIVEADSVGEFKSLLSQMDAVLSSKMHPAVLAAASYVPVLCIAYDHKQTGFFSSLGMSECLISVREISCKTLLSKIDYVWNNREKLKALLKKRVPELQKNVKDSVTFAISPFVKTVSSS